MKTAYVLMCLILIFTIQTPKVWAAEESGLEVLVTTLDPARISNQQEFKITLKNGDSFVLDATPDRDSMKAALGLNIPEEVKRQILEKGGVIPDIDPLSAFESLSPESKIKFLETRALFLSNAARILSSGKIVFGVGSLVGDGLSFAKAKVVNSAVTVINATTGKSLNLSDYQLQAKSFNLRGHDAIETALKGLDYKLWAQAPLVIESNEFSVSLSVGIVAEAGALRNGVGGAEELGFSLGYNKNSKAFVFEIYHNSENYDSSLAALTVAGVVGKAGVGIARRNGAETLAGSSFYPPAFPGYSASSSDYFNAGLSSSIGVPPPPLADLLTVTNKSEKRHLIRATVSPVTKGFVRLQFGDVKGTLRIITVRFVDMMKWVAEKIYLRGRSYCGPVFAG